MGNSSFLSGVEINNNNKVLAVDRSSIGTVIRIWNVNSPGSFEQSIASGKFPATSSLIDFERIFSFPSLNNSEEIEVAFLAIPKNQFPNVGLETFAGRDFLDRQIFNEKILSSSTTIPMIADNGNVVVRDLGDKIVLYDYQLNLVETIAENASGFSSVGIAPGISDDGKAIVFYADLDSAGANNLNITPGEGIFASIATGSGRKTIRIAGISGNGILDPGETHEDENGNGEVDPGEDLGFFGSFTGEERIGITLDEDLGAVAFVARNRLNEEILVKSEFNQSTSTSQPNVVHRVLAIAGDEANQLSSDLTGNISDIEIYNPLNNEGQVAFWIKTITSEEAIVRANPRPNPRWTCQGVSQLLCLGIGNLATRRWHLI